MILKIVLYRNFLFSASYDSSTIQFDVLTGEFVRSYKVSNGMEISSVAVSDDGQHIFTGAQDPTAFVAQWRVADGVKLRNFDGYFDLINSRP
jgi:WD40 repeat protein